MDMRKNAGFTLIEVLLVIGILVVLGSVGVVVYTKIQANADKQAAGLLVQDTGKAVDLFYSTMKRYPTSDEGFEVLISAPEDEAEAEKWVKYLDEVPKDPWGSELKYEKLESEDDGPEFRVYSVGPDKEPETDDDIQYPKKKSEE